MTVTLYKTTSDPRCLTKSFVQSGGTVWTQSFGVANTDNIDMLNPTICLAYSKTINNTNQTIDFSANYAYIDTFGRYYFIKDISVGTGGKIYLNLAIDVLGTYDTQIRACPCTITRAQWTGRTMIPDDQFPLNTNKREIRVATFPLIPFNATDGSLIIQTISGEWSKPEPEPEPDNE